MDEPKQETEAPRAGAVQGTDIVAAGAQQAAAKPEQKQAPTAREVPKAELPKYTKGEIKYLEDHLKQIAQGISKGTDTGKPSGKIVMNGMEIGNVQFRTGSWAIIYKGDTPVRMIPFVWQQDIETRSNWFIFKARAFYNQGQPMAPWQRAKTPIIVMPFDKSEFSCEQFSEGYLARVDEASLTQMPIFRKENPADRDKRVKDLRMISFNLMLYRMLNKYMNSKFNWIFIAIIVIIMIAVVAVVWEIHTHPQVLYGLTHMFSGA